MTPRICGILICLFWFGPAATASGTGCNFPPGWQTASNPQGDFVAFNMEHQPIPVSKPVTMDYAFCLSDRQPVKASDVDARMPKHQHWLNYYPTVQSIGNNRFRASGLVFHMQGAWEIQVTANPEKEPRKFTFDLVLE